MTIKTIFYHKVFPLGQYTNERIGVEVVVNEGEDPRQLFEEAKAFVEGCHVPPQVEMPPAIHAAMMKIWNDTPPPEVQIEKPLTTADKIKSQILECTDATVLKSFELLAKNNQELKAIYDNRLKELQP
jgi:hypothetical protein